MMSIFEKVVSQNMILTYELIKILRFTFKLFSHISTHLHGHIFAF